MKTLTTKQELFNFLDNDWISPFDHSHREQDGTEVFFLTLKTDSESEPSTPKGFFKRLGIIDEFGFLLKDDRLDFLVDDRSLLVNLK